MQVLILNGSPIKGGNTDSLCDSLARGVLGLGVDSKLMESKGLLKDSIESKNIDSKIIESKGTNFSQDSKIADSKGVLDFSNDSKSVRKIYLNDLHIEPYRGGENSPYTDDMKIVFESIKASQILVLASPLYWMNFSAQFKAMMDRLSIMMKDDLSGKKVALLVAGASPASDIERAILPYYKMCFINSLGWEDLGNVLASGVFAPGDVEKTEFIKKAYDLGKSFS